MPVTPETIALLGSATVGGKLVLKILGPTADYLGDELKDWAEKKRENVGRIFSYAGRRLGDKLEEPGGVSPRVLKDVVNEGAFCEDELAAEYFGGVLASSRTGVSRDDRGSTYSSLLGRLSTYQIAAHHLIYTAVREIFVGADHRLSVTKGRKKAHLVFELNSFAMDLGITKEERHKATAIITHVMAGLHKESLIDDPYGWGSKDVLQSMVTRDAVVAYDAVVSMQPSLLGVELYNWVHGYPDGNANDLLNPEVEYASLSGKQYRLECEPLYPSESDSSQE